MDNEVQDIDVDNFYFGKERSLEDYEKYAGVNFKLRAIQQYTLEHKLPPNPVVNNWKDSFIKKFKYTILLDKNKVTETDYTFWCVIFFNYDKELYRLDVGKEEIDNLLNTDDKFCRIYREFDYISQPTKWLIWPYSASKGWRDKIECEL
jgi:hypothetical protein